MTGIEYARRFSEITSRVSVADLNFVYTAIFLGREPGVEYLNSVARDLVALRDAMTIEDIEVALRRIRANDNG